MRVEIDLSPDVERVLTAIRRVGGRPVLVGGFVRDMLLGVPSKDVDIEVYGVDDPDVLLRGLAMAGTVKEAGRSFGVFKIRAGSSDLDVSLPRTESKTGAGHRGFSVIADGRLGFEEASARRDFTINALMIDPETGEVIDYHGGVSDLEAGILRHTSDAFGDDPLRVLRAVQFTARFGFRVAPATVNTCWELLPAFSELSLERIWGEWEKIGTRGRFVSKAMDVLQDTGWLGHFPELSLVNGFVADVVAGKADAAGITGEDRLVLVFAGLLCKLSPTLTRDFLVRIGCPPHIITRVLPLVREHFSGPPVAAEVRTLARRIVPATITELSMIHPNEEWLRAARALGVERAPVKALLTGDDLIARGMRPGPEFKVILGAALTAQDAGEFSDKAGALSWLDR